MFERFTESAREVVKFAQDEARANRHNYVGTEHLLIGLVGVEGRTASTVLTSLGLTLENTRGRVLSIVGVGEEVTSGHIPFTPRGKKVLELALREALSLGHNYIGTEHILLGLTREAEGVACRILQDLGLDDDRIRNEVIPVLSGGTRSRLPGEPNGFPPNFRDLERLTVYRVTTKEGKGTTADLVREVSRYFTEQGELLFTDDPVAL